MFADLQNIRIEIVRIKIIIPEFWILSDAFTVPFLLFTINTFVCLACSNSYAFMLFCSSCLFCDCLLYL